jgi:hypothetical protein
MRTSLPCEASAGLGGGGARGRAPGIGHPRGDAERSALPHRWFLIESSKKETGMAGGELRQAAAAGDGGLGGMRGCLGQAIGEIKRAVGGPVFVPREQGPAVSWLLTEAALIPPAPVSG